MTRENKSRIFITGAGGFVGANLVRALLKNNYQIHVLNHNKTIPWRLNEIKNQISIHSGDITNITSLKKIIKGVNPDYIIHLAAYGAYHFQTDIKKITKTNIIGTHNLLLATKNIPYKLFINTGTSSEYGTKLKAMKENDLCKPVSYYAATKLGATHICNIFSQNEDKPIVTFRLFSVYGPYEEHTRLVPSILYSLLKQRVIKLSHGIQRRDFIYVDDVCEAYIKALRLGEKLKGEIINIGTGIEYTNKEIVEESFKIVRRSTAVTNGQYKPRTWDTPHWKADISHAEKTLGFKAKYSIDKGLQKTYSWLTRNSLQYQRFYEENQK